MSLAGFVNGFAKRVVSTALALTFLMGGAIVNSSLLLFQVVL